MRTSKIIKTFGQWAVTTYGIECLTQYYPIEKERIDSQSRENMIEHIRRKYWTNEGEFIQAFDFAIEHFKKKLKS
jgi:hypothetical protein